MYMVYTDKLTTTLRQLENKSKYIYPIASIHFLFTAGFFGNEKKLSSGLLFLFLLQLRTQQLGISNFRQCLSLS